MSWAISSYLLFVFPGCRLLAVELTSSNTKPVVQEFQSECLARWLPCPLPGDLHQPKLLGKILLVAHGIWFLGEAGLPRAGDSEKCLRISP